MLTHKIIINDSYNFVAQYNLPIEFRGLPLEVIVLPFQNHQIKEHNRLDDIKQLLDFNDSVNICVSSDINIASLADEINA